MWTNDAELCSLMSCRHKPIFPNPSLKIGFPLPSVLRIDQVRAMHVPPRAKNPTAEDFQYCREEFQKLSRKLAKGDFNSSDYEDILFDALEYGKTVVQYAIGLQNKHVSQRHRNETDSSSDGKCSPQ